MQLEGSCHCGAVHFRCESKAAWVPVPEGPHERHFTGDPDESLMAWHQRHGLVRD